MHDNPHAVALERSIERRRADLVDQLVRLSKRRGAPMGWRGRQ